MLALRRLVPLSRSLHTSTSALRKAKAAVEEDIEFSDELFDQGPEVAEGSSERAIQRSELVQDLSTRNPDMRIGTLRKIVQLSDTPEDLEDLGRVLREWRVAGKRVTSQTAEELVGRCINLGRADLAQTYMTDKLQYGVPPVRARTQEKLAKSLQ